MDFFFGLGNKIGQYWFPLVFHASTTDSEDTVRLTDTLQLPLRTAVCDQQPQLLNSGLVGVGTLQVASVLGEQLRRDANIDGRSVLVQLHTRLIGLLPFSVDLPEEQGEDKTIEP